MWFSFCLADGPIRLERDVVLLTDDRNLRLKAHTYNVPVKDVPSFLKWCKVTWAPLPFLGWFLDLYTRGTLGACRGFKLNNGLSHDNGIGLTENDAAEDWTTYPNTCYQSGQHIWPTDLTSDSMKIANTMAIPLTDSEIVHWWHYNIL